MYKLFFATFFFYKYVYENKITGIGFWANIGDSSDRC